MAKAYQDHCHNLSVQYNARKYLAKEERMLAERKAARGATAACGSSLSPPQMTITVLLKETVMNSENLWGGHLDNVSVNI